MLTVETDADAVEERLESRHRRCPRPLRKEWMFLQVFLHTRMQEYRQDRFLVCRPSVLRFTVSGVCGKASTFERLPGDRDPLLTLLMIMQVVDDHTDRGTIAVDRSTAELGDCEICHLCEASWKGLGRNCSG